MSVFGSSIFSTRNSKCKLQRMHTYDTMWTVLVVSQKTFVVGGGWNYNEHKHTEKSFGYFCVFWTTCMYAFDIKLCDRTGLADLSLQFRFCETPLKGRTQECAKGGVLPILFFFPFLFFPSPPPLSPLEAASFKPTKGSGGASPVGSGRSLGRKGLWCTLKLSECYWCQSFWIFWEPCFTVERSNLALDNLDVNKKHFHIVNFRFREMLRYLFNPTVDIIVIVYAYLFYP